VTVNINKFNFLIRCDKRISETSASARLISGKRGREKQLRLHSVTKQEAQLSQRDRATFSVIEYSHSRLLKIIRNDTVE